MIQLYHSENQQNQFPFPPSLSTGILFRNLPCTKYFKGSKAKDSRWRVSYSQFLSWNRARVAHLGSIRRDGSHHDEQWSKQSKAIPTKYPMPDWLSPQLNSCLAEDVSCDEGRADCHQTCSWLERVRSFPPKLRSGSSPVIPVYITVWTIFFNAGLRVFCRTSVVFPVVASWIQTECLNHVFVVPCHLGSSEEFCDSSLFRDTLFVYCLFPSVRRRHHLLFALG